MKERLFYLVGANVAIPLWNRFKIQNKFVETINFVPELLPNHANESILMNPNGMVVKGETWMPEFDFLMENDSISRVKSPFSPSESFLRFMDDTNEDKDDDEWDEEEDDLDEDEDEDDDEWDEDDEDWDEDEDWEDEDDDDDEDDDFEEEEEEA